MGGEFAVPATLTHRKLEAAKLHRPEYFATFLQSLTNVAQGVTDAGEGAERDYIIQTPTYSLMGHEVKSNVLSLTS